jgi:lipopolysaccharide assembly protein A
MRWMYVAVIAVLALVTLIFALQNFQSVTFSFLRLQLSVPLALLVIIVYVLGMATGGSLWALVRWAWQGSRENGAPPAA